MENERAGRRRCKTCDGTGIVVAPEEFKCGAKTKTCKCGHHYRMHDLITNGKARARKKCVPEDGTTCPCETHDPKPCKNPSLKGGNGRCQKHNGRAKRGRETGTFKHGGYSRFVDSGMPPQWAERVKLIVGDPNILSLVPDIALIDARMVDVFRDMQDGGADVMFVLRKLREQYTVASKQEPPDVVKMTELTKEIFAAIDNATDMRPLLAQLDSLTDSRRRLVDSEVKRQSADQTSITIDRALALVMWLVDVVAQHVKDQSVITAILAHVHEMQAGARDTVRTLPPSPNMPR